MGANPRTVMNRVGGCRGKYIEEICYAPSCASYLPSYLRPPNPNHPTLFKLNNCFGSDDGAERLGPWNQQGRAVALRMSLLLELQRFVAKRIEEHAFRKFRRSNCDVNRAPPFVRELNGRDNSPA